MKVVARVARVLAWGIGALAILALAWFAANRLLDARPDSRREEFLRSASTEVPDAQNIAVGMAGLGAPSGTDFMKLGSTVKKLYDGYAAWPEIERTAQGPDQLNLTVDNHELNCLMDLAWYDSKGCPPAEKAAQVLLENREILRRYKGLYRLERNVGFGAITKLTIPATKLAILEVRVDMRAGNYEGAYRKWRDQFRFVKTYLRGQDDWVGKAIGVVDFGLSLTVFDDLLVSRPSLARSHFEELVDLLKPEGIAMFDLAGTARAEYLHLEHFFRAPYFASPMYEDRLEWLAWHLAQRNRTQNRYLAYSIDLQTVLREPWATLPDSLTKTVARHDSFGWELVIDPFGSLVVTMNIGWQPKLIPMLRQLYLADGKLRLATLVVRMNHDGVKDADIPAFLDRAGPELSDPLSNKPMLWDAKNGRVYFLNQEDACSITTVRVPVWDASGGRSPPKYVDSRIC